ncbi:prenyltransferase/squalene oxidase repeat-containing protein [Verrucomicrobiota bacterium]
MPEKFEELEVLEEEYIPQEHNIMELFEELSFAEKWRKVSHGLKQPKDSGDYKWAQLQMIRLLAPVSAVVVPFLAIMLLLLFAAMAPPPQQSVEVTIMEPETVEELEDVQELIEEPPELPDMEIDYTPDVTVDNAPPAPDTDFSPKPAEFDSVAMVKSPIIMKGILGARNPGARGMMLAKHGAGFTDGAVMRALRWLKKNQNEDGSWDKTKPAMTSLALLCYLAHGETPSSEEFGLTVKKAVQWLVDNQTDDGHFNGKDKHDYSHPIAAYALSEASGMIKLPEIRQAAEKAIAVVVQGLHPSGGWDYNCKQSGRDDTSYMGWCAQSLKAAYIARLDVPGIEAAMNKAIDGFMKNQSPSGTFGYTGKGGKGGLTGVGTLCIQLMGGADSEAVAQGLAALEEATFIWSNEAGDEKKDVKGGKFNKNYYWYYITQAKFHKGGETWRVWNKLFAPVLVRNQTVIRNAIMGPSGKMEDIGYWNMLRGLSGHTDGAKGDNKGIGADVMNTCLACLQLEVYYRYLPTYMKPDEIDFSNVDDGAGADTGAIKAEDIKIEIENI